MGLAYSALLHSVDNISKHSSQVALEQFLTAQMIGFKIIEEAFIFPLLYSVILELNNNLMEL